VTQPALQKVPVFTKADQAQVAVWAKHVGRLDEAVPMPAEGDDLEPLFETLNMFCRANWHLNNGLDTIRPFVGRILVVIQDSGAFKSRGCETFDEFLRNHVAGVFRLKRSSLYMLMRIAKRLPSVTPAQFSSAGVSSLALISKFTDSSSPVQVSKLVERASSMTNDAFEDWVIKQGYLDKGEAKQATIVIRTNKAVAGRWKKFLADEKIQAEFGDDPGRVLDDLMDLGRAHLQGK